MKETEYLVHDYNDPLLNLYKEFMTQSEIIERNWTKGLIKKFLGEPDVIKHNKLNRKNKTKLYFTLDVLAIEKTDGFKKALEKLEKRRIGLKRYTEIKRQELFDYINKLNITIPNYNSQKELYVEAIEHYNCYWQFIREDYTKHASLEDDIRFLNRISMNMIRHSLDEYEPELEKLFGKIGSQEGYWMLKTKINNLILEKYPFLYYEKLEEVENF